MKGSADSLNRRKLLSATAASVAAAVFRASPAAASVRRVVFVHGRSQQGRDPEKIRLEWMQAFAKGAAQSGQSLPSGLDVKLPFYGDVLDEFARQLNTPVVSDIHERGDGSQDEFLLFQAQLAEEVRLGAGVTDKQVADEYGNNPKERGPLNWEWVQAIINAVDKHATGISKSALEQFTRDVFLYVSRSSVRTEVDRIVADAISEEPTIVVAHSLGTVVAYNVLGSDRRNLKVPLLATVGSPLGIRAINKNLRPLHFPKPVTSWHNAFDKRDVVALNPLDRNNFPVTPAIENHADVRNSTDNRHGIIGYLDDRVVAAKILAGLGNA